MKHRPIWVDLNPFHLTVTALVSILHRLSGIILFLLIPFILGLLQRSLESEQQFELLKVDFQRSDIKIVFILLFGVFLFHFLAGIRHMLADIHVAEGKKSGKISALIVLALFFIFFVGFGMVMQ